MGLPTPCTRSGRIDRGWATGSPAERRLSANIAPEATRSTASTAQIDQAQCRWAPRTTAKGRRSARVLKRQPRVQGLAGIGRKPRSGWVLLYGQVEIYNKVSCPQFLSKRKAPRTAFIHLNEGDALIVRRQLDTRHV